MASSIFGGRLGSLADVIPGLREKSGPTGATIGAQHHVTVPMGPPLLVDGATYEGVVFIAPCDGCYVKEVWIAASVKIASGTNTLAVDNYDASANAARNVQSAATIDPDTVTALEGTKLTLSATAANLYMDEGDVLNFTLVCGTQTMAGQGYSIQATVVVPEIV